MAVFVNIIDRFEGENHFLSNFSPDSVEWCGNFYQTAEHAFQAAKSATKGGHDLVKAQRTPGRAKRAGRRVPLREGWDEVRIDVMRDILEAKFSNPRLREKLLATGNAELIEGNNWGDTFWGVCDGVGENWLGILLMEVRDNLREKE